jgi:hypothetical protein
MAPLFERTVAVWQLSPYCQVQLDGSDVSDGCKVQHLHARTAQGRAVGTSL